MPATEKGAGGGELVLYRHLGELGFTRPGQPHARIENAQHVPAARLSRDIRELAGGERVRERVAEVALPIVPGDDLEQIGDAAKLGRRFEQPLGR